MSNAQRFIPFAFGTVIVLLAANLLAGLAPPPRVIQVVQTESVGVIFRLWRDGTIETTGYDLVGDLCAPEWCPWELVPDVVVAQPGARIVQITGNYVQSRASLVRLWSNGVIERNYSTFVVGGGGDNAFCIPSGEWCGWKVVPQ